MKRAFLLCLLALALGAALSAFFAPDPGYVLIEFRGYSFETSLAGILAAGLVLWLLLRIFVRLVKALARLLRVGRKRHSPAPEQG